MDRAVAIKYATGLPAPFVIGKGRNEIARRLVAIAKEHGIQLFEAPELAESLFTLDVGDWIPEEYFEIIAEILAFVYRMRSSQ